MRDPRVGAILCGLAFAAAVLGPGGSRASGDESSGAPPAPPAPPATNAATCVEFQVPDCPATDVPAEFEGAGGLQGFVVRVGSGAVPTPAVDGNFVFAGVGNEMRCFYACGGRLHWKSPTDDSAPSAPAVSDGQVYFNTESCTLYDVEASTGRRVWSKLVANAVLTMPTVSGDRILVSGPGEKGGFKLEAYRGKDGTLLFRRDLPADVISAPVVRDAKVFYALGNGTVGATDLEGKTLWETKGEALAAPWPAEGRLLVASGKGVESPHLLSFDPATGSAMGRGVATLPAEIPLRMFGDDVGRGRGGAGVPRPVPPVGPGPGVRKRPDPPSTTPPTPSTPNGSGPPIGTNVGSFAYEGPRPCVAAGVVAMPSGTTLLLQSPGGGDVRTVELGGYATGAPVAAGNLLLQATRNGRLVGVEPATGAVRFAIRLSRKGDPVALASSPAIVRGRAYFGTVEGSLVGVDLPDPSVDGWPMWGGSATRSK